MLLLIPAASQVIRRWQSTTLANTSIFRSAVEHSKRPAIISRLGTFTYSQLMKDVERLSKVLSQEQGIQRGDRIGILMPRSYDFVVSFLATWASGGIAVPLYPNHPVSEIEYAMLDSRSSLLLYHASLKNEVPDPSIVKSMILEERYPESSTSSDIPKLHNLSDNQNDAALLLYTSGTTGKPKGVLMNYAAVESQIDCLIKAWRWTFLDKILHVLPLHHTHGLVNCLLCALACGATCEFLDSFDAGEVWKRWVRPERDLSLFMAVPTIYTKLLRHYRQMTPSEQHVATESCSQFRLMVSGSAALPTNVFGEWERISSHRLLERYGMTEIGMALGNPVDGPRLPGTVGYPFPLVMARILNEKGEDVTSLQESGELQIKGPNVFSSYWRRPEATREAFTQDPEPWFKTGDVAIKETDGPFKILGRASADIIKTGGFKISALEIERELLQHSALHDVAVVGLPSEEWGEVPALVATLNENDNVSLEDLKVWLKPRLAPYKIPKDLLILQEMPRNALGKVNKKLLISLFPKNSNAKAVK